MYGIQMNWNPLINKTGHHMILICLISSVSSTQILQFLYGLAQVQWTGWSCRESLAVIQVFYLKLNIKLLLGLKAW